MIFKDDDLYRKKSGVYKITQISTGKLYVGKTIMEFQERYWHHAWKLAKNIHDNKHLQSAWNKYGSDDFIFETIFISNENDDLFELEKKYIQELGAFPNGFNMTPGGEGKSRPMSEKTKKIIGEKNRLHNIGRKASDETRRKMSQTHIANREKTILKKTKNCTREQAKAIREMLIDGKSSREIQKALDVPYKVINGILSSNTMDLGDVEGWEDYYKNRTRKKRLSQDEQNEIYREYKSGAKKSDLAIKHEVTTGTIRNVIIRKESA